MRWWVTLGDFDSDVGTIVEISSGSGRFDAIEVVRHRPGEHRRAQGKGFTGGCFDDGTFLVTDFNSLLRVSAAGRVEPVSARPDFNDLHGVTAIDGRLWVSNTGLDRVDVLERDGSFAGAFALVPSEDEWRRREHVEHGNAYYEGQERLPFHQRRVPARMHPNHVGTFRGEPVVTCFEDRRLQRLGDFRTLAVAPGSPHDGIEADGRFWITTTDGRIVSYAPDGKGVWAERHRIDTYATTGRSGWCRGLWVGGAWLLVGLTRIVRPSRNAWSGRPIDATETSVLVLDRADGSLVHRLDLARFGQHPKVFSITAVPEVFR